jgi:type II secretory pathway pseudopilin PulG
VKRRRAGFTLIELAVSTGLVGLVVGLALTLTLGGRTAFVATAQQSKADALARRALQRVADELERAGIGTLVSDPNGPNGDQTITFLPMQNVVGGNAVWGNQVRIQRQPSPSDPDDGLDNDSDGVVDDGQLVLTRDLGTVDESSYVLCTHVRELFAGEVFNNLDDNGNGPADERGFNVQRTGSLLDLRICLELPAEGGRTVLSSVATSITLRN